MFAVIFTIGVWLRIDLIYIPGYGVMFSIDWWSLNFELTPQVSLYTSIPTT